MATRTGRLFHDQNVIDHQVNGTVPGKGKARVGGRKPLGDVSNMGKPSVSQTSKPRKSKNSTIMMNAEAVSAKARNHESNKRTASKACTEKSHTGGRKALFDISNSAKPHVPEIKNKINLKPSAIPEERMLHNHQECIKSQFETVDIRHFFKTVGLDSDDCMKISFELPASSKLKCESSISSYLEMEEVPEQLPEVQSLSAEHGSPAHCNTPKLSSFCTTWDHSAVNFKLIDTPKLSKN